MSIIGNQVLTDPVLEGALKTAYALVPGAGVLRLILSEDEYYIPRSGSDHNRLNAFAGD